MAGYGAPGKSATLLHYCGIGKDLIEYTVDRSPYKQGRFLPGTHIPIHHPDRIRETKPDYVVILALESERRNHGAVAIHPRMGWPFRRTDSEGADLLRRERERVMKVVLFCGGAGMRLRGYADDVPKPMVTDRNSSDSLAPDEILLLTSGTRISFFAWDTWATASKITSCTTTNLSRTISSGRRAERKSTFSIAISTTGRSPSLRRERIRNIGERLKAVEPHLQGEEMFLANYGDGLSDVPLPAMVETFQRSNAVASLAAGATHGQF